MAKVGVISLGCDKNRVDTEIMLSHLTEDGFTLTTDPSEADLLIVNTCAFLESARKEAIDTIFEMASYKTDGKKKLIVTGCLPQKYIEQIFDELPEVDGFLGTNDYDKVSDFCKEILNSSERKAMILPEANGVTEGKRVLTTPSHYAYLRIADGCNNFCTYCLIPSIRGKYRSRKMESVLSEAQALVDSGVKELILVAQDTTNYGADLYGEYRLPELLRELGKIENLSWIRLLYCYPERMTDELIEEIATNPKVVKYLDLPLQHVSDAVLKKMGRKSTKKSIETLLQRLKERMPDVALRSTFIVGFPGETEENFQELCDFLQTHELTNVGFFAFSAEPDTPAEKLPNQVDAKTKKERVRRAEEVQSRVIDTISDKLIGKTFCALVDERKKIKENEYVCLCRTYRNCPQIDGVCFVTSTELPAEGSFLQVRVTGKSGYNLIGIAEGVQQ